MPGVPAWHAAMAGERAGDSAGGAAISRAGRMAAPGPGAGGQGIGGVPAASWSCSARKNWSFAIPPKSHSWHQAAGPLAVAPGHRESSSPPARRAGWRKPVSELSIHRDDAW